MSADELQEDINDLVDDYQEFLDMKKDQKWPEDDQKMEVDSKPPIIELETLDTYDEFDYL
jgi:hypothetical protein